LAPSFLKHADEQTVAGIAALSQAIQHHALDNVDFTNWGVVAAPRYLGRAACAVALTRFSAEGAWGISPHLIPHRSLHALSGTVSQALKIHGPNFGVGGGREGAAEALLVAGTLLAGGDLPGVWVMLTGYNPELVPANPPSAEAPAAAPDCVAVAVALTPAPRGRSDVFLTVGGTDADHQGIGTSSLFSLEELAAQMTTPQTRASWRLRCGGWAIWQDANAVVETCL
jgi:hypothetical protein